MQVEGSPFGSPGPSQTLEIGRVFPDTEEVTGSIPVAPTIFEPLSSRGSHRLPRHDLRLGDDCRPVSDQIGDLLDRDVVDTHDRDEGAP
jgi:hypothetical protein